MNLGKSLIAALAAGAIGVTPAWALEAPPQQENGVTLITGDRVVVTGRGTVWARSRQADGLHRARCSEATCT